MSRKGFTALELLVTIAIISLLIAILLPAVQTAREAARRTHCKNNMKQIALGSHNHEATYKLFPPYSGTPIIDLMPYIDQQAIYDEFHANGRETGRLKLTNDHFVPSLLCPSHPSFDGRNTCLYQLNIGIGPGDPDSGLLISPLRGVRASEITDGLSNTVMWSESTASLSSSDENDPGNMLVLADSDITDPGLYRQFWFDCDGRKNVIGLNPDKCKRFDTFGVGLHSYHHANTPNTPSCFTRVLDWSFASASSYHPNGVMSGLCDGSVRFVSNEVDRVVWAAVGTRSYGEVFGEW